MRLQRFYMLTVALLGCMTVMAQDVNEQKKLINDIKKNPATYLYVEVIDAVEKDAITRATHFLKDEIDEYVQEQEQLRKAKSVVTMNIKTQSITMLRGDKYRAFAYIKKSDIIPVDNASVMSKRNDIATAPKPIAEQPVDVDTVAVDTTAAEPPVSLLREGTIARLLELTKFNELQPCLKQLKQEGRIGKFAKHRDLDNPTDYVLIIYNREGDIEALLSEGQERVNLKTKQADDVANYPGRGAFGVKVND